MGRMLRKVRYGSRPQTLRLEETMAKKKRGPLTPDLPQPPLIHPGREAANTSERWEESQRGKKAYRVEPPEGGWDANYVPGYSDERHMWESKGQSPTLNMPARLQWVRCVAQEPAYRDWMEWSRKGYILLKADPETRVCPELERHGWEMPPAAFIKPNGLIQKGTDDAVLAYCAGDAAKENYRKERADTEYQEGVKPRQGTQTGVLLESHEEERSKVKLSDDDVSPL